MKDELSKSMQHTIKTGTYKKPDAKKLSKESKSRAIKIALDKGGRKVVGDWDEPIHRPKTLGERHPNLFKR